MNPAAHRNRLDRFTPIMVEAAQERADSWAAQGPQGRVDMLEEMAGLTAEVIARAVFGTALGAEAAQQVIDETLRLYPPVPLLSRQAGGDDELCGAQVKKGSLVLVSTWLLHRHRKYRDDPDTFRPERFLGAETPRDSFHDIPFAAGPPICAGLSFAQDEMVLLVAVLLRRFSPRVVPDHTVHPTGCLTLRPVGGMPMHLNPQAQV